LGIPNSAVVDVEEDDNIGGDGDDMNDVIGSL
jgi:hypothetical protein